MQFTQTQLTQSQRNDAQSQRELYDLYKARVMGICRRYTSNKEEAEDVFQESFIKVFQNIGQVQDAAHVEQWVWKIAVNTAINYYHKNKRHDYAEERNGHLHTNTEYELILSRFTDEMLMEMINELPEGYRLVFNLYVVEGYSHAEVAKLLHISEATSRSQLNRAKQVLKSKLNSVGILKYERHG